MITFADLYKQIIIEKVIERNGKWLVTNKSGSKILGTHSNKEDALEQLHAIEISKKRTQ